MYRSCNLICEFCDIYKSSLEHIYKQSINRCYSYIISYFIGNLFTVTLSLKLHNFARKVIIFRYYPGVHFEYLYFCYGDIRYFSGPTFRSAFPYLRRVFDRIFSIISGDSHRFPFLCCILFNTVF